MCGSNNAKIRFTYAMDSLAFNVRCCVCLLQPPKIIDVNLLIVQNNDLDEYASNRLK